MIQLFPNETLPWMWVIFMVVLVALSRLVFGPTLRILDARKAKMSGLKDQGDTLAAEVTQQLAEYEVAVSKARVDAGAAREKIIAKTREEERVLIDQARQSAETWMRDMRTQLENEKKQAHAQLKSLTEGLATDLASKILERKVN